MVLPPPPSVEEGEEPFTLAFTDPDEDLPPGRLHAIRGPERLAGTKSPHPTPSHIRKKSLGSNNPRSRSRSPSLKDTASDSMSSLSLEDVDSDILTDKMGLSELNEKQHHTIAQLMHQTSGNLAPVNERMSEETLDDVHAFSDARPTLSSRGNSTAGSFGDVGNCLLETLDECEEDAELDEKSGELEKPGEVMVLNLENLTILEHDHEQDEDDVSLEPVCGSTGPV